MSGRMLSLKEIEEHNILIQVLKETLPSLSGAESIAVKRCILRHKREIEDSDRRMKYGSRKAN